MKDYIRNGAKVLFGYVIALVVFSIFSYIFMSITGDKFNTYLPYYCFVVFLFAFLLIYSDMKRLALKEIKPQYDLHPYPFKGLVYGILGFLPFIIVEIISALIVIPDSVTNHLKHVAVNILVGPEYFLIRIFSESALGYVLASLLIPLVAMLGYLAGYYNASPFKFLKKKELKPVEKGFVKSPWNPTNKPSGSAKKKKKKTGAG